MILLLISTLCLHSVLGGQQVGQKVSSIKQHFNNSNVERHPWLISILDGDKHKCSGSIISSSLILTSAYCTLHPKKSLIVEVNHGNGKKSQHRVVTTKRHEQYNETDGGIEYDIALLKVSPLIKLGGNVINIILSEKKDYIVPNTIVTSAGLPPTTNNGSEEMSSIELRVLKIDDCPRHVSAKKDTAKGLFCAGRWSGDVCEGDAGGPIFIAGVQVGIISWNAGCVPRLYIDVAHYNNWIKASSGKLNKEESTIEYIEDISKTYLLPMFWPFSP